ncbi:MAG: hypothetical protein ACLFQK_06865 [Fibrobacterota bacterium]
MIVILTVMEKKSYAVFDIGSNSLILTVAKTDGDVLKITDQFQEITRLSEGIDDEKKLRGERFEFCIDVINSLKSRLDPADTVILDAVITSPGREITNSDDVLDEIFRCTGIGARVISGQEEAEFSFSGAAAFSHDEELSVVDLGGGSVEVMVGKSSEYAPAISESFSTGALKIMKKFMNEKGRYRIGPAMRNTLSDICGVSELINGAALGIGGVFTSIAMMEKELSYFYPGSVQGFRISSAILRKWIEKLNNMPRFARKEITGLHPERSDSIIGGLIIAETLLGLTGGDVIVSESGLRIGILRNRLNAVRAEYHYD